MVLKATANDKRHLALCHDEFRGPRTGLCQSGGISNNKIMNGLHLALRHERQKVNRIVMRSECMANCPPVKEWPKSFGFDSFSSLVDE
ncbi:UNVERIFIED_CONTAM: hypothetical protein NCL1_51985 [Trichonephila clavipes]